MSWGLLCAGELGLVVCGQPIPPPPLPSLCAPRPSLSECKLPHYCPPPLPPPQAHPHQHTR